MHVYNEEEHLKTVFKSFERLTVQPEKVLLVNDGSINGTLDLILESGFPVLTLNQSTDLPSYARRANAFREAVEFAKKETPSVDYLLKVDGDTIMGDSYAEETMKMSNELGLSACSGITTRRKTRDLNNGAVLYRFANIPPIKTMYAWDREIQLDLVRRGHKFKVCKKTYYMWLRPATVKGSPGLKRVFINRVRSRIAELQGFVRQKP